MIIPFGKFKGLTIEKLPKDYCHWVVSNVENLDADLKVCLENHMGEDYLSPEMRRHIEESLDWIDVLN